MDTEKQQLTTTNGQPMDNNEHSLTVGPRGPVLLQDFQLINKLQHFARERVPERVAHAQGMGAHGYFEVTHDVSQYCKARFLNGVGKKTPVFARLSTTIGSRGSSDLFRDIRGFAWKFYTEEGNYDMVGINFPVFFIRDMMKGPDFFHAMKMHPVKNFFDANTMWDFFSQTPESLHCVTMIYTDRGTPQTYRNMHGFSVHTFKWVNNNGQSFLVKYTFRAEQGIKNFNLNEAKTTAGYNAYYSSQDLYEAIEKGDYPAWTMFVQIMPETDGENYKWDVYDPTKCWPHADYPLIPVGRLVLNKNVVNYFAEVEQVTLNPANLVPGIEATPDRLLQGRMFLYQDTQFHRAGPNHHQIPINCPLYRNDNNVDGQMTVNLNQFKQCTYAFNAERIGPQPDPQYAIKPFLCTGPVGRFGFVHKNDDFEQVRTFYNKVLSEADKDALIYNICQSLGTCNSDVQKRMIELFNKVDPDYGSRVQTGLTLASMSNTVAGVAQFIGTTSNRMHLDNSTKEDLKTRI